jgi:PAS domain-containing protein
MRKTREEQLKHAEENQIRRYQNEGIAKFSDILRSNSDNLMKLSDVFIKEIVKYLEAIQGGLFLLNKEGDEELHLVSSFAYNRKKYQQKTIRLGESLVGTCALERKTINLTDIPDEYIEITSGMGDAPPNNLILFPIMHEEHLIGVMELASIKKFDENQIILGEKIASSLASTIISARVNSQTSELLQKSQQQAAEMAEQEEEMRQNMEELKATQEESARREEELEGILNAIDQAFYVIEYDFEGTIQKVNQRFLYLVNLHADKVIGKTHSQLFGKKSKADALLFANVSEGNTVELNEKIEVNGIALNLKNTFSPIKSKEGKTIRILNIITINL